MRSTATLGFVFLAATLALGQTAATSTAAARAAGQANGSAAAPAGAETLPAGSQIRAKLKTKLDSNHAKVGDRVTAVTTSDVKENGTTVLPKGTSLIGKVTEASKANNGHEPARIGVLFNEAVTKPGVITPLHAAIVSVIHSGFRSPAAEGMMGAGGAMNGSMAPMAAMPAPAMGGGGGLGGAVGGLAGGVGAAGGAVLGGTLNGVNASARALGNAAIAPMAGEGSASGPAAAMARASNGVPLQILAPTSTSGRASMGSVLTTQGGNLRLDSGSELMLEESDNGASTSGAASASAK